MSNSQATVSFTPWIGSRYEEGGVEGTKVLVLGESHYGDEEEVESSFTRRVVQSHVYNGRHRFFTIVAKLLLGKGAGTPVAQREREWVWDRIAFYNYVQSLAGTGPDGNVTDPMWEEAKQPFLDVVEVTRPDIILVVGREVGDHLPDPGTDVSRRRAKSYERAERLTIPHVSRGFSYDPWLSRVDALIGESGSMDA